MIFTTYWFACAVACFFVLYAVSRQHIEVRRYLLLGFCVIFHGHFAGAAGVLPIIVVGFVVYFAARSKQRHLIFLAMALSVTSLAWYKYTHFFALHVIGLLNSDWGEIANTWGTDHLPQSPPLAISFFTFEYVHYLFDVSRGSPPIRSLTGFWNFTLFFPTLVAGPIKRYQNFLPALEMGLASQRASHVAAGLMQMTVGFLKKVVVADNLSLYVDYFYSQFASLTILGRWGFVVLISMRILLDFSGYSDIAIGLARVLGVEIPANFNWPYLTTNIRDFWQRWHISLSSWIRDYVYIPLGGNRKGLGRTVFNGILAFALCGLWHGPTWNFIFWGLYHGFGLALSSNYQSFCGPPGRMVKRFLVAAPIASWAVTMIFVGIGWLYFFYPMAEATKMVALLVGSKI